MTRNKVKLTQNQKKISLEVEATSEEMASKIYELIETALIAMGRVDLERDWRRDDHANG